MKNHTPVAIIGAGPYGLSLAAHLGGQDVDCRIFGKPMQTWKEQMPRGMRLKSEGFASTLYDPDGAFTLERFCGLNKIPYAPTGLPVSLETFVSYGMEFQRRMVPQLEQETVLSLEPSGDGFRLVLEDGRKLHAAKVVVAAGISHFQHLPPGLSALPGEYVSHTSEHTTFDRFRGRNVTVVGGGASALDVAALLRGAGAEVRVIARKPLIHFHNPPGPLPRTWLERVRAPMTGLGPGWKSLLCVRAPLLFHRMPQDFRHKVVSRHLGPAAAWFVKDAVVGKVELHVDSSLADVRVEDGRVHFQIVKSGGKSGRAVTDHVIAGTGYQTDLAKLSFLGPALQTEIRCVNRAPVLSSSFESSVPGLYFVGSAAAPSFGPLLRFAYGAGFTARRLSKHLADRGRR